MAGLKVVIEGGGHNYVTHTDGGGRFHVHVPAGDYAAHVESAKRKTRTDYYGFDEADKLRVANGGCADVVLEAEPTDPFARRPYR
jgi:hypothetical protein